MGGLPLAWLALLAVASCARGCGSTLHPSAPPLAPVRQVAGGLAGPRPPAPALRLAGGGVRPGTTDYSKWEQLARLTEESEAAEGLGHGTDYWKGARVTKLKSPSPVHLAGDGYTIEGEVEGYEGAADYSARAPAPGTVPRARPQPASTREGGRGGEPRVEEVGDEGTGSEDEGGVELSEPERGGDLEAETERVRRAATWQGVDGLEPLPPLDTGELADAVSGLDPYEGLPPPREGEDVTFIDEEQARRREGLRPARKLREPKVQTWEGKKWATVDYSKWEDLKYSQSEADGKNKWGPDPHSAGSRDSEEDSDDIRVRESIRMDIARAAAARDEHALRQALRAADAVSSAKILQPEEIHAARQILWEIIDEKEAKQELVWRIREDQRRANDTKVLQRQVIAMMMHNGGRTDRFLWCQDADTVTLHVFAPNETKGIDVAVKVKERFLRISLHEPQDQQSLAKIPAEDRPCKCVILGGKMEHRVRAEDGELNDWEVQDLHDEDGTLLKVVKVVLRKKPPGANFVPSSFEPWEEGYLGPGNWRESQLRVWWSRVFRTDPEINVTAIKERGNKATELSTVWRQAHEQFALEVDNMKPIDLSELILKEAVDDAKLLTTNQLTADGVPEGSLEWNQTLARAEEDATKRARKDMDKARLRQAQRKQADDDLNERWQQHVAEKGDESTDYNSEGDVIKGGFMGSFPHNQPRGTQRSQPATALENEID